MGKKYKIEIKEIMVRASEGLRHGEAVGQKV